MKKRTWELLAGAFLAGMLFCCACGASDRHSAKKEQTDHSALTQNKAEKNPQPSESLPELRIGVDDLKPFFYVDQNGDYAGIDAEIAMEACRRAGYQPVFQNVTWDVRDQLMRENPGAYRYLGEPLMAVHLGVAFAKDADTPYRDQINEALASMKQDGTIPGNCEVMRIGGDEFLILGRECPRSQAEQIVEQIRSRFARESEADIPLSAAFGIHTTEEGTFSFEKAYYLADQAMYQNKKETHC